MIETLLERKTYDLSNPQNLERLEEQPIRTENPALRLSNICTEAADIPGVEFGEDNRTRMNSARHATNFNSLLVECIHETILSLLSLQVAEALYAHLEDHYSIGRDEIPYRLETLLSTFEKIFGPSGRIVGKAIAKRFYSRLGLKFEEATTKTLVEYVEQAKMMLQPRLPTTEP